MIRIATVLVLLILRGAVLCSPRREAKRDNALSLHIDKGHSMLRIVLPKKLALGGAAPDFGGGTGLAPGPPEFVQSSDREIIDAANDLQLVRQGPALSDETRKFIDQISRQMSSDGGRHPPPDPDAPPRPAEDTVRPPSPPGVQAEDREPVADLKPGSGSSAVNPSATDQEANPEAMMLDMMNPKAMNLDLSPKAMNQEMDPVVMNQEPSAAVGPPEAEEQKVAAGDIVIPAAVKQILDYSEMADLQREADSGNPNAGELAGLSRRDRPAPGDLLVLRRDPRPARHSPPPGLGLRLVRKSAPGERALRQGSAADRGNGPRVAGRRAAPRGGASGGSSPKGGGPAEAAVLRREAAEPREDGPDAKQTKRDDDSEDVFLSDLRRQVEEKLRKNDASGAKVAYRDAAESSPEGQGAAARSNGSRFGMTVLIEGRTQNFFFPDKPLDVQLAASQRKQESALEELLGDYKATHAGVATTARPHAGRRRDAPDGPRFRARRLPGRGERDPDAGKRGRATGREDVEDGSPAAAGAPGEAERREEEERRAKAVRARSGRSREPRGNDLGDSAPERKEPSHLAARVHRRSPKGRRRAVESSGSEKKDPHPKH